MRRLILIGVMLFVGVVAQAQVTELPTQVKHERRNKHKEGDFRNFQMQMMIKQLSIAQQDREAFKTLYTQYLASMAELRPKGRREGGAGQAGSVTSEQVERHILESFDVTDKITALKREYYPRFRELLSPEQILRMYSVEREIHDRIDSERRRRE